MKKVSSEVRIVKFVSVVMAASMYLNAFLTAPYLAAAIAMQAEGWFGFLLFSLLNMIITVKVHQQAKFMVALHGTVLEIEKDRPDIQGREATFEEAKRRLAQRGII
jgi:hypothetical protein